MGKSASVGKSDELCECVGAFRAAEQSGMADLLRDMTLSTDRASSRSEEEHGGVGGER